MGFIPNQPEPTISIHNYHRQPSMSQPPAPPAQQQPSTHSPAGKSSQLSRGGVHRPRSFSNQTFGGGQGQGQGHVDIPFTNQLAYQQTFIPQGFSFENPFVYDYNNDSDRYMQYSTSSQGQGQSQSQSQMAGPSREYQRQEMSSESRYEPSHMDLQPGYQVVLELQKGVPVSYPGTNIATGDRFLQLLEAKLNLDQSQCQSRQPFQPTAQQTIPTDYQSSSQPIYPPDPLAVETALQDYRQLTIPPDYVAPLPDQFYYTNYYSGNAQISSQPSSHQASFQPPSSQQMSNSMSMPLQHQLDPTGMPSIHSINQGLPLPQTPYYSSYQRSASNPTPISYPSTSSTSARPTQSPAMTSYTSLPSRGPSSSPRPGRQSRSSLNQTSPLMPPPPSITSHSSLPTTQKSDLPPLLQIRVHDQNSTQPPTIGSKSRLSALSPPRGGQVPIVTVNNNPPTATPIPSAAGGWTSTPPRAISPPKSLPKKSAPKSETSLLERPPDQSKRKRKSPIPTDEIDLEESKRTEHHPLSSTATNDINITNNNNNNDNKNTAATTAAEEKKPTIACHLCRSKKLKCDGARPRCATCTKKGEEKCEYDAVLRRRGPGKHNKRDNKEKSGGSRKAGGGKGMEEYEIAAAAAGFSYSTENGGYGRNEWDRHQAGYVCPEGGYEERGHHGYEGEYTRNGGGGGGGRFEMSISRGD